MKKLLCVLLALLLIISIVGCSSNQEQKEDIENLDMKKPKYMVMMEQGEFDEILCSGDGYHIVKKTEDNYDGYKVFFGVVDSEGNWNQPLSEEFIFAKAYKEKAKINLNMNSENFIYLGDGVFIASKCIIVQYPGRQEIVMQGSGSFRVVNEDCYFYNVKNKVQKEFEAEYLTPYVNGYMLMSKSESAISPNPYFSIDEKGTISKLPCVIDSWLHLNFSAYSDGVFFAEGKFFDIEGNVVLDISKYDLYGKEYGDSSEAPYFVDGKCTIKFRNDGGSLYKAVIDKQGNFVEEPTKIAETD
ncbi:MAG: hypothetical protein IKB50_01060 [Clostridia bacterium]|nr:hypothetical protein [Clostridia bacterium]